MRFLAKNRFLALWASLMSACWSIFLCSWHFWIRRTLAIILSPNTPTLTYCCTFLSTKRGSGTLKKPHFSIFWCLTFGIPNRSRFSLHIYKLRVIADLTSGERKKVRWTVVPKNGTECDKVGSKWSYKRYLTAAGAFTLEKSGKRLSYSWSASQSYPVLTFLSHLQHVEILTFHPIFGQNFDVLQMW